MGAVLGQMVLNCQPESARPAKLLSINRAAFAQLVSKGFQPTGMHITERTCTRTNLKAIITGFKHRSIHS